MQFLTGRKQGVTARILRFNCETKLTNTVQKLSKNSWLDQSGKGGGANTPLLKAILKVKILNLQLCTRDFVRPMHE